ncbi:MAG TPA: mechanosensitive ion channel [Campylobacterales bacterium]|nr:mechanosensitive ion channel [Campylobacterales bacterium]
MLAEFKENPEVKLSTLSEENKTAQIEASLKKIEVLKKEDELKNKKSEAKRKQLEIERIQREEELKASNLRKSKIQKELEAIDHYLKEGNIWSKVYSNYETYQLLEFTLTQLENRITQLNDRSRLTEKQENALKKYEEQYKTTKGKIEQLKEYKVDPFKKLLMPDDIGKIPEVESPLDIISAVSFQKHLTAVEEDYNSRYLLLKETVSKLHDKGRVLSRLIELNVTDADYADELELVFLKLKEYKRTLEIFKTSQSALVQKISELKLNLKESIAKEAEKGIVIGSIILFLLLFFIFVKYLVRKYMLENELFYTTNKVINFIFITILSLVLLFSYLENVDHLVSILGFASAGIAIALKDWFMSIMGWFVIIFSGSIHVGDRIKLSKDGNEYLGDVVDISILRMTLHEDVTLTTESLNRRAGRIIFVPNNYIFTDMIANYSHSGLKTVWDGIDFMITFDSDVAKAQSIAKEVSRKYSKGYTDMTRKQLNRLRSKYSMRNTSVEPRIFAFLDEHGVRISVWYLTNAYATLTLRSTISMEILMRIREEEKIEIAFPSQSLFINQSAPKTLIKGSEVFKKNFNKEHGNSKKEDKYEPDDWGLY